MREEFVKDLTKEQIVKIGKTIFGKMVVFYDADDKDIYKIVSCSSSTASPENVNAFAI